MTDIQRDTYEGQTEVQSLAFGCIDRDNRNHQKKRRIIENTMVAKSGDSILEVGCGHGLHAREYDNRYHYTGIDIATSLLEQTRTVTGDSAFVLQANAMDLPFADNQFDSVVGTAILHHLNQPRRALKEWLRVCDGGSVTLMEPNYIFPKECISTHTVPEEQHKINMAPWRLSAILADVREQTGCVTAVDHRIFTPPWPRAAEGVYDWIDRVAASVPVLRRTSQMQLIDCRYD